MLSDMEVQSSSASSIKQMKFGNIFLPNKNIIISQSNKSSKYFRTSSSKQNLLKHWKLFWTRCFNFFLTFLQHAKNTGSVEYRHSRWSSKTKKHKRGTGFWATYLRQASTKGAIRKKEFFLRGPRIIITILQWHEVEAAIRDVTWCTSL